MTQPDKFQEPLQGTPLEAVGRLLDLAWQLRRQTPHPPAKRTGASWERSMRKSDHPTTPPHISTPRVSTVDPEVLKTVTKMAADVSNGSALPKQVVQTAAVQTLVACQKEESTSTPQTCTTTYTAQSKNWFRASDSENPPFVKKSV